jgi:hypothetical protein
MRKLFFAALAVVCGSLTAQAMTNDGQAVINVYAEPVKSMPALGRIHSWRALDNDTLIVWATAFRPYLVELRWPSPDMRFTQVIGVTETTGRVHSRFDSVLVRGIRYPIDGIYRLSPEVAKSL